MITAKEALKILNSSTPLINTNVEGVIELSSGEEWRSPFIIENCTIQKLSCVMVQFHQHVLIKNSYLEDASFNFTYFLGGLTIENCVFDEYLDFEAGGHNSVGNNITISNNQFHGFVNFCDCWFKGEISVYNNTFGGGTNILSKKQLISFDNPLSINNNAGVLDIESECRNE